MVVGGGGGGWGGWGRIFIFCYIFVKAQLVNLTSRIWNANKEGGGGG